MAVVLGITVGILGITGWHGFVYHYTAQIAVRPRHGPGVSRSGAARDGSRSGGATNSNTA